MQKGGLGIRGEGLGSGESGSPGSGGLGLSRARQPAACFTAPRESDAQGGRRKRCRF